MPGGTGLALAIGGLMVSAGLAFKLSAVPFHFWCPDVFAGAAAEVGAFLSVASKAAAIALLLRVAFGLGTTGPGPDHAVEMAALGETRHFIVGVIALLAALTCTLGNLAAYGQTNMKRLLAYSTIAHAGYLMMGVAAAVALAGRDADASRSAVAAVCFYLGTYVFMNLAAFAIVALLRNSLRSEEIASYAGLIRTNPGIVVATGVVHHLDDAEAKNLFAVAKAALNPGGRLVTLDGCYEPGQSRIAKMLLDNDRGKFVRTESGYRVIATAVFPHVTCTVLHDMFRMPYTVIIMECST
jgi:SAM-dependent methyltransferase